MRRPLLVAISVLLLALTAVRALAAPLAQGSKPVIAEPQQDAAVRGVVQIVGSATHPQFQRYELYYAAGSAPADNAWVFIGDAHLQQQPLGLLGTWNAGALPDGTYVLRVRVVKADGNYIDSDPRRVLLSNRRAITSPTPTGASLPTTVPTPLPPTPTIVVALPTIATPRPAVTATPKPESTSILPAGAQAAATPSVSDVFDTSRLVGAAKRGATYTIEAFAVLAAFFAVKALLVVLWHKFRP